MAAVAIAVPALLVQLHQKLPTERLAPVIATGGRGVGITVALAAVGFCFGLLFRHTVAALGIALGYFLIVFVRSAVLGNVEPEIHTVSLEHGLLYVALAFACLLIAFGQRWITNSDFASPLQPGLLVPRGASIWLLSVAYVRSNWDAISSA